MELHAYRLGPTLFDVPGSTSVVVVEANGDESVFRVFCPKFGVAEIGGDAALLAYMSSRYGDYRFYSVCHNAAIHS